jgi:hypothetical protein
MEVYQEGQYWRIHNDRGPLPNALKGDWVSKKRAEEALKMFQAMVRSRAINVSQKSRERKQRATATS